MSLVEDRGEELRMEEKRDTHKKWKHINTKLLPVPWVFPRELWESEFAIFRGVECYRLYN